MKEVQLLPSGNSRLLKHSLVFREPRLERRDKAMFLERPRLMGNEYLCIQRALN